MKESKIFFSLSLDDIQNVAVELYGRKLEREEIEIVGKRVGDTIGWYDAIDFAISSELGLEQHE